MTLRLVDPPANLALGNSVLTGTIDDDDALTVGVEEQETTVAEGSAATFLVELQAGTPLASASGSSAVVVEYEVTGVAAEDYEDAAAGTLTIPAEESTGTITIMTLPDDLLEDDETLTVALKRATTPAGPVTVPAADAGGSAMTTIGDRGRKVTIEVLDATGNEGGNAVFDVRLSGKVSSNVELSYETGNGTATGATDNTGDFASASGVALPLMLARPLQDHCGVDRRQHSGKREGFSVTESGTLPDGVVLRRATAQGTIIDQNTLSVSLRGPNAVAEGSDAVYTVTLANGVGTADVVVDYTVGGTATADTDYTDSAAGKLTIALPPGAK